LLNHFKVFPPSRHRSIGTDSLRPGIAHVRPVTSDNQILFVAFHPHNEVVLDRKDGDFHAIDHEQLAARAIQQSGLEQAKLLRSTGLRQRIFLPRSRKKRRLI